MARPQKLIEADRIVEGMASIGSTDSEIATTLGLAESTVQKRFRAALKKGRTAARLSIRRNQFRKANEGNVTMLIWLGKQMLGQRDDPIDATPDRVGLRTVADMVAAMSATIPPPPVTTASPGPAPIAPQAPQTPPLPSS